MKSPVGFGKHSQIPNMGILKGYKDHGGERRGFMGGVDQQKDYGCNSQACEVIKWPPNRNEGRVLMACTLLD